MSRAEFVHGPDAGVVGDGLVPSRPEFAHGPGAVDRKGRPYEIRAESPAKPGTGESSSSRSRVSTMRSIRSNMRM